MNTYEELLYILRLLVITVSAVLIVAILALTRIEVGPTQHYHADTHTAQIMYGSEFFIEPGVIDAQKFRQESLPAYQHADEANLYIDITLIRSDNSSRTITLHEDAKARMQPLTGLPGIHTETTTLPVTVSPDEAAILRLEVHYALE